MQRVQTHWLASTVATGIVGGAFIFHHLCRCYRASGWRQCPRFFVSPPWRSTAFTSLNSQPSTNLVVCLPSPQLYARPPAQAAERAAPAPPREHLAHLNPKKTLRNATTDRIGEAETTIGSEHVRQQRRPNAQRQGCVCRSQYNVAVPCLTAVATHDQAPPRRNSARKDQPRPDWDERAIM